MNDKIKIMEINQSKQGLVPKLRFPEFYNSGKWKEERLGDIGKIITGSTPPTSEREYYEGEYLFVSPFDIQDKRYVKNTKTTLTKSGFLNGRKVKKGSSLFVCIGSTIGKVAQAKYDCITNQQINAIVPTSNNENFVFFLLQFHSSEIQKLKAEQAVPIINKTTFSNYVLHIPNPPEQQKIADCLSSIDELITTESEKLEAIRNHKKGLMQNLFPCDGKTTPNFRFPEFKNDGDWEEKTLGDVAKKTASTINLNSLENNIGNYPVYGASGLIAKISNYASGEEHIGIIKDGSGVGRTLLCPPKSSVIGTLDSIKAKDNNSIKFIYYWLLNSPLNQYIIGGAIPHIYFKDYSKMKFGSPSPKEQQKIANCLSSIDDLITSQTQKIEALKIHKKGFMQQLFPNLNQNQ
jgi:type I restriction enzyme S subunit